MRFLKPAILSLVLLALVGGSASAKNNKGQMKHSGMDRNSDGVITLGEWRGNDGSFNNQDWNGDGILSGDEVWPGARPPQTSSNRFDELDNNNNGYVSRGEWNNTGRLFQRLDRNSDGRLIRNEFYDRSRLPAPVFSELDVNNDGRVSRGEWRGDNATLARLDVNGDDFLSENEFNGRQTSTLIDIILQDIFKGR